MFTIQNCFDGQCRISPTLWTIKILYSLKFWMLRSSFNFYKKKTRLWDRLPHGLTTMLCTQTWLQETKRQTALNCLICCLAIIHCTHVEFEFDTSYPLSCFIYNVNNIALELFTVHMSAWYLVFTKILQTLGCTNLWFNARCSLLFFEFKFYL